MIGDPIPYTSQKVHRPEFFPERDRSTCACLTARSFARSLARFEQQRASHRALCSSPAFPPAYTVRARFFGNDTGHSTNSWRFERLRSPNRRTTISRKPRHFVCNRGSVVNTVRNIESPILPVGFNRFGQGRDTIYSSQGRRSTSNC